MKHSLTSLSELHQSENERAFFFSHREVIQENLYQWKSGVKNLQVAYSLKANYDDKTLNFFGSNCDFLEVASLDEFELASHHVSTRFILVNGPIYTVHDLRIICSTGAILIIESLTQLKIINELQKDNLFCFRLGVRIRVTGFPSSRFGISEEELKEFKELLNTKSKLELLHCHYCEGFRSVKNFGQRIVSLNNIRKKYFPKVNHLNIGGGYYSEMPVSLSQQFKEVIPSIQEYVDHIQEYFPDNVQLTTEIGAGLVANAVDYICRVEDLKTIDNQIFIVTNGSKWDIKPNGSAKNLPFQVYSAKVARRPQQIVKVVGYTCMEDDIMFNGKAETPSVGDFLVFKNCGAYAQSLSPDFIINRKNSI